MGNIPYLISWNLTKRCNLKCGHCYLDAAELDGPDQVSTSEALGFIDNIAELNPNAMLILTGGEPLLRADLLELSSYATSKGFTVVLGTNGTLLDDPMVEKLKNNGIRGVGVSLDSVAPTFHDEFRGLAGAWQSTIKGMEALKRNGLDFQVQLTVTQKNRAELPRIIELSADMGARAVNVFFLVCTGRGQDVTDITPAQYEEALTYLVRAEQEYEGRIMVRARCAPHFLRIAGTLNPDSALMKGHTSGCIAGTGYLRITPEGFVTPCPYIPADAKGFEQLSLRERTLKDIWDNSKIFRSLRDPVYAGRCGDCEFNDVCGGCRARALAETGDIMGEDPWCEHEPDELSKEAAAAARAARANAASVEPQWSEGANERLKKVPIFLRGMVKKGVERYAKAKGLSEITPDIMAEMKKRSGR